MKNTHRAGLSIIELIVVIGVIALSIPAIFGLFFTMLRARAKTYALQEVKRNGDVALNIMETLVRQRASAIYQDTDHIIELCSTTTSFNTPLQFSGTLHFKDKDGIGFYFATDDVNPTIIASRAGNVQSSLTNQKVTVNNFSTQCFRSNTFSPPIVKIDFDITSWPTSAGRQEENATIHYTTQVKLRN